MAEYVNREEFVAAMQHIYNDPTCPMHIAAEIEQIIYCAPVIDAEPIRNGRIIEFWDDAWHPRRRFSCCGTDCTTLTIWVQPKYCPYCGAKMDNKE